MLYKKFGDSGGIWTQVYRKLSFLIPRAPYTNSRYDGCRLSHVSRQEFMVILT